MDSILRDVVKGFALLTIELAKMAKIFYRPLYSRNTLVPGEVFKAKSMSARSCQPDR